jgi:hypothetical protein
MPDLKPSAGNESSLENDGMKPRGNGGLSSDEIEEVVNNVIKLTSTSNSAPRVTSGSQASSRPLSGRVTFAENVTECDTSLNLGGALKEPPRPAPLGLSPEAVRFYVASLVLVLGHLRSQSIAFRNLKPENVMLDAQVSLRKYSWHV